MRVRMTRRFVARCSTRPQRGHRAFHPRRAIDTRRSLAALSTTRPRRDSRSLHGCSVVSDSHARARTHVRTRARVSFTRTNMSMCTAGLLYSHKLVGQTGNITRLMACDEPSYDSRLFSGATQTHVHPNMYKYEGDAYTPYNKPYAIKHFLENNNITEDYIAYIDADMVFRKAFTVDDLGAEKGRPVAAYYGYMKAVEKDVHMGVKQYVKNVENAQKVGGFVVMHREDLKRVAPLWLKYTAMVRKDPDSWANTGDIFNANGKGGPPWISEMYGYSFGCAEAGVNHTVSDKFMLYPGYKPQPEPSPYVMHYGLMYHVNDFAFDKHRYIGANGEKVTKCPGRPMPQPPPMWSLTEPVGSLEYRQKWLALYTAHVLHNATYAIVHDNCNQSIAHEAYTPEICVVDKATNVEHCHKRKPGEELPVPPCLDNNVRLFCPTRPLLLRFVFSTTSAIVLPCAFASSSPCECRIILSSPIVLTPSSTGIAFAFDCLATISFEQDGCCDWAGHGECEKNPSFMSENCRKSCGMCAVNGTSFDCHSRTEQPQQPPAPKSAGTQGQPRKAKADRVILGGHHSSRSVRELIENVELESSHIFHAHGVVIIWVAIVSLVGAIMMGTLRFSKRSRRRKAGHRSSRWSKGAKDANGSRESRSGAKNASRRGGSGKKIIAV